MLTIKRKIRLSETDATGVLYFTNQLKFATEAFEELLEMHFPSWTKSFEEFGLPIVEARSLYLAPLKTGDEITIALMVEKIGDSSIELYCVMGKDEKKVGETRIKHVLVSKKTGKSVSLPAEWRRLFSNIT